MKVVRKAKEPLEVIPPAEKEVVVLVLVEAIHSSKTMTFNKALEVLTS